MKKIETANLEMAEKEKSLIRIMQTSENQMEVQKAFNELYANRHIGILNKLKVSLKGKTEDAEDLLQEVFIKAWKNIKLYNFSTNFSTWLYSVAKNVLIDHIRKQRFELIRMDAVAPSLNDGADSYKERKFQIKNDVEIDGVYNISLKENKDMVTSAINSIKNSNMRDIIRMKYIDQLTGDEICNKLGMNVGTYKANNHRAEQFVKEYIVKTGFDFSEYLGQKNPKRKVKAAVEIED